MFMFKDFLLVWDQLYINALDKHGTEFAISALPLGGYVSMITNKLIEHEPEVKRTVN